MLCPSCLFMAFYNMGSTGYNWSYLYSNWFHGIILEKNYCFRVVEGHNNSNNVLFWKCKNSRND